MPSVFDVAAYILTKSKPPISHMKLQKLAYYAQAWSLVWDEQPLFPERIEAWANGPVVPDLYQRLKGQFNVSLADLGSRGDVNRLDAEQKATIDQILSFYGSHNPQWLSDLTHMERPWRDARAGLPPSARSEAVISLASMAEYYGSL